MHAIGDPFHLSQRSNDMMRGAPRDTESFHEVSQWLLRGSTDLLARAVPLIAGASDIGRN